MVGVEVCVGVARESPAIDMMDNVCSLMANVEKGHVSLVPWSRNGGNTERPRRDGDEEAWLVSLILPTLPIRENRYKLLTVYSWNHILTIGQKAWSVLPTLNA